MKADDEHGAQSNLSPTELARALAPLNKRISVSIRQRKEREVAEMPYSVDTLPPEVKSLPKARRNKWMAVFNAAKKNYAKDKDGESKAFGTAWSAIGGKKEAAEGKDYKRFEKIAAEKDYFTRILHLYELSSGSRLMVFPRGTFIHPEYGEMKFDDAFFDEIIANYTGKALGETKPFVDVDHNHGAACAWFEGLTKEPDGLYAQLAWTSLGEELVATGQYKYFSPWWGAYKDPSSGKLFERVLRGGALTNIPFLKVLPAVELYEPGKQSSARDKAFKSGVSFRLAETTPLSLPPNTSVDQASAMVRAAFNDQFSPRVSQMPYSSPYWISDIFDDHVIACYDSGPGYAPRYYRVPFTQEDDGIVFHPEEQEEVRQVWQPITVADTETEPEIMQIRQRYGEGRAVAHVLAERCKEQLLHVLSGRHHGA